MSELSPESKALLEAEAPLDEPTAAELDAMHARVTAALAGVAAPAPAPADPTPLAGKVVATSSAKLVGTVIATAVGSGALLLALNQPAREAPIPARSAPVVVLPPAASVAPVAIPSETLPAAPLVETSAPRPVVAAPRPVKPAAPASTEAPHTASEEALLVATAEAQLRAGHAAAALALYEQHLREYSRGALRHESQTGRLIALCSLGRGAEIRAEVQQLVARHPGSPTAQRLQRACGLEP